MWRNVCEVLMEEISELLVNGHLVDSFLEILSEISHNEHIYVYGLLVKWHTMSLDRYM